MWDFEIGKTLGLVVRTWPFVILRMIVYFGITLAYIFVTGAGAGVGYGVGHITGDEGGPLGFGVWGGIVGFSVTSLVLYWIREYILYIVKAGHIAAMVHLLEGRPVPGGEGQIAYARKVVTERFGEANILFALDQLVKGVIGTITGLFTGVAAMIPIPGLSAVIGFANTVIRMSLTYVDEIILAYNMRQRSDRPFETACQGVVLYAQNGKTMLKNALWLSIFMWVIAIIVFLWMLAPAAAVLYYMPGQMAGWGFVVAILMTWAIVLAFVEPFCIAALMQVYFKVIAGQVPDPAWEQKLNGASKHFRELKDKALASAGVPAWGQTRASG